MNRTCIAPVLWLGACLLLAGGCAEDRQLAAVRGPGKELARKWAQAARQPVETAADASKPEPKLLPMTHFSSGNLLEKQGNYAEAIQQYNKAIELNSTFAAAYSRLGLCYTKIGQYGLAVQALKRSADLQPASPQLWNNLGFAYMAQQDYAQAEPCLTRALLARPGFVRARMNLAICQVQLNRDGQALSNLLAVVPEAAARYDLGAMQLAAGRSLDAKASFERALAVQADFPAARKGLEEAMARLSKAPAPPAIQDQATARVQPASPSTRPAAQALARTEPAPLAPTAQAPPPPAQPAAKVAAAPAAPFERPAIVEEITAALTWQTDGPADTSGPLATAAPATRPIEGIDDEPAIANAPASFDDAAPPPTGQEPEIAVSWSYVDPLALARPVVLSGTGDTSLSMPTRDAAAGRDPDPASTADSDLPDAAIAAGIVCRLTSREMAVPDSVVDLDLVTLRWAAWSDAVQYLDVDIASLAEKDLPLVLSKWLCAVNELESVTPIIYGLTAYADDM